MTTLETRIYSHPPIPLTDISPLEMLILTNVLECSETEDGLVLFTDVGSTNPVRVPRSELVAAFRTSAQYAEDPLNIFIASRVLALLPAGGNMDEDDAMIDIDLSQFPWQFVVQGIVARSQYLREVTVIQWMNHPSQRPESFGASVSLITAKAIHHATSEDLLARFRLQDKSLLPEASSSSSERDGTFTGRAASDPFTVKEIETALCIWEAMLYFRGLHQDERPVPDNIVCMSEVWDTVGWQEMRSHVPALIETLHWSEDGADLEGEPEELLDDVMVAVRRRRQDVVARTVSGFNPASCQVD
jgi:hypothetical protein